MLVLKIQLSSALFMLNPRYLEVKYFEVQSLIMRFRINSEKKEFLIPFLKDKVNIFVSVSGSQRNQRECDKRRQRRRDGKRERERKEMENWNSCACDVLLGKSDFFFLFFFFLICSEFCHTLK